MLILVYLIKYYLETNCLLTEGENEGGLAAVALTIGEENVKGTQGGVEIVGGSWKKHDN